MPVDSWVPFVLARARSEAESTPLALAPVQEHATAQAEAARPWVLLSSVPRIRHEFCLPRNDLSLELAPSPRVSVLTVSDRVFGRRSSTVPVVPLLPGARYPYVAAVDQSGGALLLCANNVSDWDGDADHHHRRYLLCNPVACTASDLVDLVIHGHPGSIGMVRRERNATARGTLTVAVLTPAVGSDRATLFSCSPRKDRDWAMAELACKRQNNGRPWENNGAFALHGKLWWVDLACGLLTCDLFYRGKVVCFVDLPPSCAVHADEMTSRNALLALDKTRCVNTSGGKVRFVHIHRPDGIDTVTVWSLDGAEWEGDYSIPFRDIWADESYATEPLLVEEVPVLALLHPYDPTVHYFWQRQGALLFAINVPAKKVVECGDSFTVPH